MNEYRKRRLRREAVEACWSLSGGAFGATVLMYVAGEGVAFLRVLAGIGVFFGVLGAVLPRAWR